MNNVYMCVSIYIYPDYYQEDDCISNLHSFCLTTNPNSYSINHIDQYENQPDSSFKKSKPVQKISSTGKHKKPKIAG